MGGLYKKVKHGPVLFIFALSVLLSSYAAASSSVYEYRTTGVDAPVIERAIAAESISPGTTWRLYLWASDPSGDISTITYAVEQPGVMTYSPGHLKVAPSGNGRLQGYLYMNTVSMAHSHGWQMWYTVKVSVEDKAGNISLPRLFTVYFNGERQDDVRQWERAQLASQGLDEPPSIGRIHTELVPIGEQVGAAGGEFSVGGP